MYTSGKWRGLGSKRGDGGRVSTPLNCRTASTILKVRWKSLLIRISNLSVTFILCSLKKVFRGSLAIMVSITHKIPPFYHRWGGCLHRAKAARKGCIISAARMFSLNSPLIAGRRRHAFYEEEIDSEPDNLRKAESLKGFSWPQRPERSSP